MGGWNFRKEQRAYERVNMYVDKKTIDSFNKKYTYILYIL